MTRRSQHPYGELNFVVPLDAGAKLMGPRGWSGPGWTAPGPGPGSHHYPEVKGGALIALFYLPAGRISYDITRPPPDTGEGWACHGLRDDDRGRIARAAQLQGVPADAGAA